jgi:hypothetical protein
MQKVVNSAKRTELNSADAFSSTLPTAPRHPEIILIFVIDDLGGGRNVKRWGIRLTSVVQHLWAAMGARPLEGLGRHGSLTE